MSTAELFVRALALGTSTLYEASGLNRSVDPAIRAVWPGAAIAAPAFPVHCSPGDNLAIHIAMERAPRGSVLVVGTDNFVAGYWGEVLTVAAEAAGLAGLVIDGGVRDLAALAQRRFPVFSRGVSVRAIAPSNRCADWGVCCSSARPMRCSTSSSEERLPRWRRCLTH